MNVVLAVNITMQTSSITMQKQEHLTENEGSLHARNRGSLHTRTSSLFSPGYVSAASLAHLWQFQDKRQAASALLAPVYAWFTEGFERIGKRNAIGDWDTHAYF
jgi:hypothetical protein